MNMKVIIGSGIAAVVAVATLIIVAVKYERIQPGYVGVSVKKCSDGGVAQKPIQPGIYWREMFCEEVVEYPVSMQSLVLTKNPHEGDGDEVDQSITINSSEGLGIEVDVAMNFTLEAAKVPQIYEKWRATIKDISAKYIRQTIREGLQLTFAKYTAEELYSTKKEVARAEIEAFLSAKLGPQGFVMSQFTINRIQPPQAVVTAINQKVAMIQDAQRSEQEVRKRQAEAAQAIAAAEGRAKSMTAEAEGEARAITLRAEAQAKANELLSKSLTPELVEYEKMRRWNGVLPQFTGNATPMFQVNK